MNKSILKSYAPQARNDFIAMVTSRANQLGIGESSGQLHVEPCTVQGDVALIGGQAYPAKVAQLRQRLLVRIKQHGFGETMDAVAYTWFNRFAALRYMELHDYLGHGHRVLTSVNPDSLPDILTHALELVEGGDLPGIRRDDVAELKLAGKDGELYKRLLVAQCNKLASAMPFLFERIDDETELLLPDNLLRTDSVVRKLVDSIDEADWDQVEVIGWLYQFYISEKKDAVIGKVVKSEDIPAATQLFTPNWIVKYLVQNSVGRLWLQANPQSTLASQWEYYIQPAEQTPEVQAQLDALIQGRIAEDDDSLNPESITVLDPACGSGHILVEAYELLKGIYLERGYRLRDIPRLILEKNLYGLDIDDRAAQLAGFALLMKGRADDRRLFDDSPRLNLLSLQESKVLDLDELATQLAPFGVQRGTVKELLDTFEHAKTFGSLIQIPDGLNAQLTELMEVLRKANETGDLYAQAAAQDVLPLVEQAQVLGRKFDAVVANPPYMGSKFYCAALKHLVTESYTAGKADLYGAFTIRNITLTKRYGYIGMITIPNWMFLSAFEALRKEILASAPIASLIHNGRGVWGSDFGSCAFTLQRSAPEQFAGRFMRLFDKQGSVSSNNELMERFHIQTPITARNSDFVAIPGSPLAYWVSERVRGVYNDAQLLRTIAMPRQGIKTGENERFLRQWFEVSVGKSATVQDRDASTKWFPCTKGGAFRKWYGNHEYVLNWEQDGWEIRNFKDDDGRLRSRPQNTGLFFRPGITWSTVSIAALSMRIFPKSFVFESKGSVCFPNELSDLSFLLALLNSKVVACLLDATSPSVDFSEGAIGDLPVRRVEPSSLHTQQLIEIARTDWDSYESSWDFQFSPLLTEFPKPNSTLEASYTSWITENRNTIREMKRLEEENNRLFIDTYRLADELTPDVQIEQITLTVNPSFRYGGKLTEEEQAARFRQDTMEELISYGIGCMMGRYSLNEPGLIYAHAGNIGFDATRYQTFPADADGIVPITDEFWFEDDAAIRVREFLLAVWGADTLDENMAWLAESLGAKANETPGETVRRYLSSSFFKDHLQSYKKRPIYWLFSSGKQKAFEALVYLHRYNEGTLARMRAEYLVPLTGKMAEHINLLEDDALKASTPAARKKIDKDIEKLKKKLDELRTYDEKLRHYADMRISLDLDDGVKVNYGKFGDLLAEVKAVTGGKDDE